MEYKNLDFPDPILRSDITDRLKKELDVERVSTRMRPLTREEINMYIEQAMEEIKLEGNNAPYQGLILFGVQTALSKIRESR